MKNTKNANAKSHIKIKYKNINVNFKANFIAFRKLFHTDHSSDMIDHIIKIRGVLHRTKMSANRVDMNILRVRGRS